LTISDNNAGTFQIQGEEMKRIFVLSVLLTFFLFGCGKKEEAQTEAPKEQPEEVAKGEETTKPISQEPITREKNPMVVMETSLGNIEVELFFDKTPKTAENFLRLVISQFYDGLIFHRVIPNFTWVWRVLRIRTQPGASSTFALEIFRIWKKTMWSSAKWSRAWTWWTR
jgi:hypothetical protein